MNSIWYLSKERNLCLIGFNRVVKPNGNTELWVKEASGESRKVAEGQQAIDLEGALLDIVWKQAPAIITDGKGAFSTNVNFNDEEEEIDEEEVE